MPQGHFGRLRNLENQRYLGNLSALKARDRKQINCLKSWKEHFWVNILHKGFIQES